MLNDMNAHEPLVYRPTFLERILWFLSSIRIGTKSIRALQLEDIG